jgi:hypothetical protein
VGQSTLRAWASIRGPDFTPALFNAVGSEVCSILTGGVYRSFPEVVLEVFLDQPLEFCECDGFYVSPLAEDRVAGVASHDGIFQPAWDRNVLAPALLAAKRYWDVHETSVTQTAAGCR